MDARPHPSFITPPRGCAFTITRNGCIILTASCRDTSAVLQLLSLSILWTCVVGLMLDHTLSGTLALADDPFARGSHFRAATLPTGTAAAYWLITGALFVLGGLLWTTTAVAMWGVVRIKIDASHLHIFTGFGSIGARRVIGRRSIRDVRVITDDSVSFEAGPQTICLNRYRRDAVCTGAGLSDGQRSWLAEQLRVVLADRGPLPGRPKLHAFA